MELRRIQVTRGGTFFVTLPKEWALKNGLSRGSIVATSETADGRLIIDPKYDVERAPLIVTIRPSPYLDREIIGKYLLGYDIIRIEAKDRISLEDRERIKRSSSRLIGLEIIEEDYSRIVMQCLLEPSALPPEKILRREHSIASSMHKDAVTALVEGDTQLAKSVIVRDNEVDRLYFLLVRILRTIIQNPGLGEKLKIYPIDCLDYRLTASLVESIGDQSAQIAEHVIQLNGRKPSREVSRTLLDFHRAVFEAQELALVAFFSRSISMANSVREKRSLIDSLYHKAESAINTEPPTLIQHLLSATSIISRIYDHSIDISDLTMPRHHEERSKMI